MTNKHHIFYVEDDPYLREVVGLILDQPHIKVTCYANPFDCLTRLNDQSCDLLITDLFMPGMNGLELLDRTRQETPWLPVLVVTACSDIRVIVNAMKKGAVDVIEKPFHRKPFLEKVSSILNRTHNSDSRVGRPLTITEMKILKLVMDARSSKEIAFLLHRSVRTIEVHRASIMRKLAVNNLVDLIKRTAAMGLIRLPVINHCDAEMSRIPVSSHSA